MLTGTIARSLQVRVSMVEISTGKAINLVNAAVNGTIDWLCKKPTFQINPNQASAIRRPVPKQPMVGAPPQPNRDLEPKLREPKSWEMPARMPVTGNGSPHITSPRKIQEPPQKSPKVRSSGNHAEGLRQYRLESRFDAFSPSLSPKLVGRCKEITSETATGA